MSTEHRGVVGDGVGHAPEHPAGALHPLVADHDEVGALTVRHPDDGLGRLVGHGVELGGDPLVGCHLGQAAEENVCIAGGRHRVPELVGKVAPPDRLRLVGRHDVQGAPGHPGEPDGRLERLECGRRIIDTDDDDIEHALSCGGRDGSIRMGRRSVCSVGLDHEDGTVRAVGDRVRHAADTRRRIPCDPMTIRSAPTRSATARTTSAGSPGWAWTSESTERARAREDRPSSRLWTWLSGCTELRNSLGTPDDDRVDGLYAVAMCSRPPDIDATSIAASTALAAVAESSAPTTTVSNMDAL